jgi:hypothetical protein
MRDWAGRCGPWRHKTKCSSFAVTTDAFLLHWVANRAFNEFYALRLLILFMFANIVILAQLLLGFWKS